MREDEPNWFPRWEEDLPLPEELMPLSQTLITPDLALAFDIRNPNSSPHQSPIPISSGQLGGSIPSPSPPSQPHSSEFDSAELGSGNLGDEPARTLKRPRLVWTPQLHKRFADAVEHLDIKNAVPKTIMQLMSVDGLTRENVASHLQKYRLYLKRTPGVSAGGGARNVGGPLSAADAATDRLFASAPVPHHFLHPAPDHYLPFVPVLHHQQQQMAAAAVLAAQQQQQYHQRQVGQFGSPPGGFLARQLPAQQQPPPQPVHRMGAPVSAQIPNYVEDMESATGGGGRKVLTLFPTGYD